MRKVLLACAMAGSVAISADPLESPTAGVYVKTYFGEQYGGALPRTRLGLNFGYSSFAPETFSGIELQSIPAMIDVEFSSKGLETLNFNNQPLVMRKIRLNSEEEEAPSSYTSFDMIAIVAAVGAALKVTEELRKDEKRPSSSSTSGGGGGGVTVPCLPSPPAPPNTPPGCTP